MSSDEIETLVREHMEKTFSIECIDHEPFLCYCIARNELIEEGIIPSSK